MRRIIILWTLIWGAMACFAQSPLKYSRVNVDLTSGDPRDFVTGGFDLEHGLYLPNRLYISDMSEVEIERVRDLGFDYKILIDDVQEYYVAQSSRRSLPECQEFEYKYKTPENFTLGSSIDFSKYLLCKSSDNLVLING